MTVLRQLLDVPSTDPEDARRRKLLNILLLGLGVVSLLGVFLTIFYALSGLVEGWAEVYRPLFVSLVTLIGMIVIFLINRYGSGWIASLLFLVLIIVGCTFADQPNEVANGRSLVVFAIPIVIGSVILPSYASFLTAAMSCLAIAFVGISAQVVPNLFAMGIFFAVGLVSWLSARSLEHALRDLRVINRELDQRVDERTRDLAEALSRNQAVLEGIADGVIVFNRRGEAMIVNPAMTRLIHRPANEIIGYDIDVLMAEEVADTDREAVGGLLRDQESSYPGLKFEWGDKTFSVSLAPVRDNFRRVTGTVAVFRDFTREAEIDRMKSAFVSMVSHELRTPLNAVLGYAEILREALYGPLSDKQLNAVNRIIANTDQLLNIVSNLLDQAQIESGRLTLNVTPFAPAHLIDEVVGGMNVLAQTKDLVVRQEIAGDVPARLFGDRQRLHQVLVNLVGNAIKFTEEGEVGVRAYRSDGNCWALEVWDTGCGIPEEAHEYIFDAFRRADDSLTRKYAGTGLGLSIVKQLVNLMEGDILLDSEVGQGSTFTVVLPLISEGGA